MAYPNYTARFPKQRVSASEKNKPEWYENCIDFVISKGLSVNDRNDTNLCISVLHGDMPNEFYKKTLNPYNADNERFTRFPATLRNFDIMKDIIRRYVSEYFKGIHEFTVGANNPEIVLNKNRKLKEKINGLCQQAFQQEFEKRLKELYEQAEQSGRQQQIDPQQAMPDPEEFIENFNRNYIDNESKQGQDVLDYVRAITKDTIIYLSAFFNYCSLGECYSYADIRDNEIIKECVPVTEAYPIPNSNFFVEDHDMFARKLTMSYQQILDTFDKFLSKKDIDFLDDYYSHSSGESGATQLLYSQYFEKYPDSCAKFTNEERDFFKREPITVHDINNDLYEVWHVVWRGEARRGIVTYQNELGFVTTKVVDETYKLDEASGDISIEWEYEPQVYEGYRIGNRYAAVYPIKARPIAFNRNGKLPYNGMMEILPLFGKFSIIKLISPYQVMRNIFIYHREMVIAKNKMMILLLPQSLISDDEEDKIYKMAADGTLLVNDEEDVTSTKMQQVRMLNANMGDYIAQMTQLIDAVKYEARETVDMNAQRYGEIAQSAGAATTQQSIAQSSMGSVIVFQMFDEFRKTDYNRDIDYAKLAYIEGLDTSFFDINTNKRRYISLDVNSFVNSDYSTTVRNDAKEIDKLQQLKQWAFSAAQNGDLESALAAIKGDNVSQIADAIERFATIKRQHEEQMQQMEQMLKQEEIQAKIAEIQAKGEEDRKTMQVKYYYEMQMKYVDVDMSMLANQPEDTSSKDRLATLAETNKREIENNKLNLERQKLVADTYNAAADRQVKLKEIETNLKIAKENKNQYDRK